MRGMDVEAMQAPPYEPSLPGLLITLLTRSCSWTQQFVAEDDSSDSRTSMLPPKGLMYLVCTDPLFM
jgi:hypothetical protein